MLRVRKRTPHLGFSVQYLFSNIHLGVFLKNQMIRVQRLASNVEYDCRNEKVGCNGVSITARLVKKVGLCGLLAQRLLRGLQY